MRYLKQKIAKAHEYHRLLQSSRLVRKQPNLLPTLGVQSEIQILNEIEVGETCVKKDKRQRSFGNNVMKNYANAMVKFALSRLADPYLSRSPLIKAMPLYLFGKMLASRKKKINCVKGLREMWMVYEIQDTEEMKAFKGLFKEACKVFLKQFWVNWIYNSRLDDKSKHLIYRGRLLRRIENPQWFTYLETFKPKESKKQRSKSLKNTRNELRYE